MITKWNLWVFLKTFAICLYNWINGFINQSFAGNQQKTTTPECREIILKIPVFLFHICIFSSPHPALPFFHICSSASSPLPLKACSLGLLVGILLRTQYTYHTETITLFMHIGTYSKSGTQITKALLNRINIQEFIANILK